MSANIMISDIVHGMLGKVQKIFRGKAASFARNKMEEGDHWLKKGKLERALAFANIAVVRAPLKGVGSEEVDLTVAPLSLWVRSKILFEMSEYQYALNDIQLALKYHLPNELKPNAYLKMGKCYLNLGDKKKCIVSLTIALKCGNISVKEECDTILKSTDKLINPQPEKKAPSSLVENSPEIPGLTKSVTPCKDEKCGRYVKANTSISAGDFVAYEKPYASLLFIEKHGTHCLHCYSRLKAPIPCPDCSGVGFCSNECLNEGMEYHKWECPYLELHIGSGMSVISHLSLRMITQHPLDYFKSAKSKTQEFQRVLCLEGHKNERDGKDLFRRALMALFLLQSLRHGGYFQSASILERLNPDEMLITCLLLHNLQVIQYNAHEIYETVIPIDNKKSHGQTLYIGLGLYLNVSMLNHQCQPTLARYFQGKNIVLRAQRPIEVGENVTENYGPVFTMRTKEQRQAILSGRYLFDCDCGPCLFDWPMLSNLSPNKVYFRCKQALCSGSIGENEMCSECGKKQSIKEEKLLYSSYQEDWNNVVKLMKLYMFHEVEQQVIEYINNMWALVKQPNKNLCLAMEALRTIWANTTGNVVYLPIKGKIS